MNNTKVNQKIKSLIEVYCKDTTNIQSHLDLAKAYYDIKQYASAVTYLNRIAEMSDDSDIIYESLCLASQCFSGQGNRTIHVKVCLYHAISVLPDRPEAYFLLSKSMEIDEPFQCYSYCVIAQCHKDNAKRVTDLPFEYDYYKLLFQKAVNAWHAQKVDECKAILYNLYIKYPMDKFYKELVVSNLNQIGWPKISNIVKSDLPKKVGIDIGACIGEALHQFEDFDIVYAIEPAEEEFKILKEKYKNDKRIIPIQCAISDKNGEDILNCYENGRFSSMLEFNKDTKFYKYCEDTCESFDDLKEKIKVKTIRLDTFIEKYNLNKIDYIKIDTQGYDLKVVQSLGKYIKNIKKIRLEVQLQELYKGSSTKKEIIQYMNNNNFQLIDKVDGDGKEYEQDLIFENKLFSLKDKIDIVIQGQYDDYVDELIEHYKKLDFVNNIIVSCWEEDKESVSLNGVKFIRSKYPDDWGTGNRNLQIVSSLTGLKQVTTKYAVKVRSDQKYSHKCINDMYDYFIKNKESALKFELNKDKPKNSIITGGIFSPFPFHPRDHIFWGYKDDLIDLFNISLESSSNEKSNYDVTTNIRTESYIGTHYCSNFDNRLKLFLKEPEKYLYDNCEKINETLLISDKLTHKVFKSVPSNIIELEWPKYGWTEYQFDSQRERFGERWAEDFERE